MHHLLTPRRFASFSKVALPVLIPITLLCLIAGLYTGLLTSPADYQQGDTVRIMYVHVPAAWMALGIYTSIALAGVSLLVWKNPLSGIIAQQAAPIGAMFALLCLITGSIWGKLTWGTWWVWDARLTSMLILFFFYIGLIALENAYDDKERSAKATAILSLVGVINIPIIKFSVEWWNTLHQPASILRKGGIAVDSSMLTPLLLMAGAYIGYFLILLMLKVNTELAQKKANRQNPTSHF
ncbi:MAG: heme transporter HemC [Rickettsiales bacterium]|nr:heme transporter HemC [Rickettsiales bacterium]